jgi:hypothetical protein
MASSAIKLFEYCIQHINERQSPHDFMSKDSCQDTRTELSIKAHQRVKKSPFSNDSYCNVVDLTNQVQLITCSLIQSD